MARDKTFNALDDIFEDDIDLSVSDDLSTPEVEEVVVPETTEVKEVEEVTTTPPATTTKAKKTTQKKAKSKPKAKLSIDFAKKESAVENRTYRMKQEIIEALNSIVHDNKGNKIKGSRGFLSDYVNYAVAKELIEIGLLEEAFLEELVNPYED